MATILQKALKRQVTIDGLDYTVAVDPEGVRLTGKGKRRPEVELFWRDLLSGEAAMSAALNASLTRRKPSGGPEVEQPAEQPGKRASKKRTR